MKVLAKEPAARYRTADQLGRVLMTFGQRLPPPAIPAVAEPPSSPVPAAPTVAARPVIAPQSQPLPPYREPVRPEPEVYEPEAEIDWISVGLGLLALMAVGGLVPLWIAIIFRWASSQ
jgi:serine/threonine-protein kinase